MSLSRVPPAKGARYRCLACATEWTGVAGPQTFGMDGERACPNCPSLYVEWLNHAEMFE